MTDQEIFDAAVGGVLKQGVPSYDDGTCFYRSGSLRCAAGFLIPDADYSDTMEFNKVSDLAFFRVRFTPEQLALINELQQAHDNLADRLNFTTNFMEACGVIAARRNLNTEIFNHVR